MNRKRVLWSVIILTALTTTIQYAVQGAMAANHNPAQFPLAFWYLDFALWALRAMIEAVVIAYLFTTIAKTRSDKVWLFTFEFIMLAMIAVTLHVIYKALGQGKLPHEVVSAEFYSAWTYAIAAYAPIMMAGAGVAYRVQPIDANQNIVNEAEIDELNQLRENTEKLLRDNSKLRSNNEQLQSSGAVDNVWQSLSKAQRARAIVSMLSELNGNGPDVEAMAREAYGSATVSRAIKNLG